MAYNYQLSIKLISNNIIPYIYRTVNKLQPLSIQNKFPFYYIVLQ